MSGSRTCATVQPRCSSFTRSKADDSKIFWLSGKLNANLLWFLQLILRQLTCPRLELRISIPYSTVALNILSRYVNITAKNTKRIKDAAAPYPSRKNW